jgi:hypothetical protein
MQEQENKLLQDLLDELSNLDEEQRTSPPSDGDPAHIDRITKRRAELLLQVRKLQDQSSEHSRDGSKGATWP